LLASAANAQEESPESPGWTPSLSVGFGITSQSLSGTSSTTLQAANGNPVVLGAGDSNDLRAQYFSGTAELYAPPLTDGGWAPRLFVHAGGQIPLSDEFVAQNYLGTFGTGDDLAGNCKGGVEPITGGTQTLQPRACVVRGKNTVSLNGNWFAGIGVDLTLPISRRQFHLRPSIDYFGQSWEAEGLVARTSAVSVRPDPPLPALPPAERVQNRIEAIKATSDTNIMHGVGPRLQLVLQLAEVGEFGVDLFLETQFYWILSDNDVQFSGSNAAGSASFESEVDSFVGQGGGGIRVVWKGD
jgi:hypothetical protein